MTSPKMEWVPAESEAWRRSPPLAEREKTPGLARKPTRPPQTVLRRSLKMERIPQQTLLEPLAPQRISVLAMLPEVLREFPPLPQPSEQMLRRSQGPSETLRAGQRRLVGMVERNPSRLP